MKLDIHQRVALWWVLSAPFAFAPVLSSSHRPHVGALVAQGVVVVTACIAACPLMLRWSLFRSLFCWTDAFSKSQREALRERSVRRYYIAAAETGYIARLKPYMYRIMAACFVLMLTGQFVHGNAEIVVMFATWYPLGVLVACIASMPLLALARKR